MINLPDNIRNSKSLASHHLEMLAEVNDLPVIDPSFEDEKLKNIFQYYSLTPDEMDAEVHRYAAELLNEGKIDDAWQVLLSTSIM